MRWSLKALVKSQILYSALKRNKFQKTHILKMECLSPTISYTFSDVCSVFRWDLPVQLGCYTSTLVHESYTWTRRFIVKMQTEHLSIWGDQYDVVLCVCVFGRWSQNLLSDQDQGCIISHVPLVGSYRWLWFPEYAEATGWWICSLNWVQKTKYRVAATLK